MNGKLDTPWHRNWQLRLSRKLGELGFTNLDQFLEANPGFSYVGLARLLADANIAALQIYGEQIRRAAADDNLRQVAMDSLVRFLAEHVKRGWGQGSHFDFRSASAFADWKSSMTQFGRKDASFSERLDRVILELKELPPAMGWVPTSSSDKYIKLAFDRAWPESARS